MTTDTVPKIRGREVTIGGVPTRVTGIAKGAAMIGPNMGTMLVAGDDRRRAADERRPGGARRRGRRIVPLHQRRRPHEHERHGDPAGERRGRRAGRMRRRLRSPAKPSTTSARRCSKCARTWPNRSRPTAKGRRTSSPSKSTAAASRQDALQDRQDDRRQPAGENGHRRRRPELGPHRFGGRLRGRARSTRRR